MTPEPLPSLAALLAEADRVECDALALRQAFPRAVARVLHLGARGGSIGRRAASLNTELARAGVARRVTLAPTEPPLRVVEPMWAALLDAEPVEVEQPGVMSDAPDAPQAVPGPPQRLRAAVRSRSARAGGAASATLGSPRTGAHGAGDNVPRGG